MLWQQNVEGRKGSLIPKIVIGRLDLNLAPATSGEGARLNRNTRE